MSWLCPGCRSGISCHRRSHAASISSPTATSKAAASPDNSVRRTGWLAIADLRQAGYVVAPFVAHGRFEPDRVRVPGAGENAFAAARLKEPLISPPVGGRYIVHISEDRLGFVRRDLDVTSDRRWKTVDNSMEWSRWA